MPIVELGHPDNQKYLYNTRAIVNLPYGLMTICSYLEQNTSKPLDIKIININDVLVAEYTKGNLIKDTKQYFENYVAKEVDCFKPNIVGISLMFNIGFVLLDRVSGIITQNHPDSLVIVGGNLATVMHKEIAMKKDIDAVCYGEGELPFKYLAETDDLRTGIENNAAFVTKDKIRKGIKPTNYQISDLNALPPINFDYVNLTNFNEPKQKGTVYKNRFSKQPVSRILFTSRGCPFNCCFCSGFQVHGKKVRFMEVAKVLSDVKHMIENDGLTDLFICDDSFLLDIQRGKTILNEFIKLKINVYFPALLMRNIDDEVADLLAKLGNTFLNVSLESGSEYVLKEIIKKPLTIIQAKRAVQSLRKYNIKVLANVITGFPKETDEHRKECLETLQQIGFDWIFFMIALPLPGSRLYDECLKNGYLVNKNFCSPSLRKCNISTPMYSPEHIEKQAYMMNLHSNFIHNYNLLNKNFDECIKSFNNIVEKYPKHAFAYYGLMRAYQGKNKMDKASEYRSRFIELLQDKFWKKWAEYFNIL
jgi:radical SAM superfamily enzyme YgiQ (UPF0313 family)